MQMIAGGGWMLIAGLARGELAAVHAGAVSAASLGALVYLIVAGSLVAFSAYAWLLRVAPTPLVATYAYVNPVVAILLGVLFLNENLSLRILIGAAIVVTAVAVVVRQEPPVATQTEEGVR